MIKNNKKKKYNNKKGIITYSYISNLEKATNTAVKITSHSILDNFVYRIFNNVSY